MWCSNQLLEDKLQAERLFVSVLNAVIHSISFTILYFPAELAFCVCLAFPVSR